LSVVVSVVLARALNRLAVGPSVGTPGGLWPRRLDSALPGAGYFKAL